MRETALSFPCHGEQLVGILSLPERAATRGVLVVVGGPQYRAGSHRQFTLLARQLSAAGVAAMRFDYRGMGDSEGAQRGFEDAGDDLRAAVDRFFASVPGLTEVVLWGLCDGATAASFYACDDARVRGLVLLNPWVRTERGIAQTTIRRYYRSRLLDPGLWRKIAAGRFDFRAAAASALGLARTALARPPGEAGGLPQRMMERLRRFDGRILLVLSGADLTAQEFDAATRASTGWRRLLRDQRVTRRDLPGADHTFSQRAWQDSVASWTCDWVRAW